MTIIIGLLTTMTKLTKNTKLTEKKLKLIQIISKLECLRYMTTLTSLTKAIKLLKYLTLKLAIVLSSQIRDQQFLKSRNPKGPSLQPHHFCGFGGFAIFSIC